MAFKKRKPGVVVDNAKLRLDGMKQIDIHLGLTVNYGSLANVLTKTEMSDKITDIEKNISDYNVMLEDATALLNEIVKGERQLDELYTRVLKGAVAQFGSNSDEVEVLGGTRISERKPPKKKTPPAP